MAPFIAKMIKYWKPLAVGIAIVGVFFAGVRYKSASCEVEKHRLIAQYTQMIQDEVDRRYEISLQYEDRLAEFRVMTREIVKEVEVEVVKPIYTECRVPQSGINLLNETVDKLNKARKK